jgi:hypothetical protein
MAAEGRNNEIVVWLAYVGEKKQKSAAVPRSKECYGVVQYSGRTGQIGVVWCGARDGRA